MRKILKLMAKIILIISIIVIVLLLLVNVVNIIRIMFFGMEVGSDYPDTIWWGKQTLQGLAGIKTYYYTWRDLVYIEIPISIACVLYQIVYFKIIRKKL